MPDKQTFTFFFVINKRSGTGQTNWPELINGYFKNTDHRAEIFELPDDCNAQEVQQKIIDLQPDRVIAVGGDGTVKLVASCILNRHITLGIVPAGSANGMAKELGLDARPEVALQNVVHGVEKKIHLLRVNEELCIHLSDIGFNAFLIRQFEDYASRGMWGYLKASWSVFWKHSRMQLDISINNASKKKMAAMVVIANATKYGTGALINPEGSLDDDLFEVIVIKRISLREIFKMMVTHQPYNPAKTEVYQTKHISIHSKKAMHFQVDGEYLGKVHDVKAVLIDDMLQVLVPASG